MTPLQLAAVALGAPAAAALILAPPWLRRAGWPAAVVTILGSVAAVAASVDLAIQRAAGALDAEVTVPWLVAQGRAIAYVGLRADGLSSAMLIVVTVVALCVQVFSTAYMNDETPKAYGRYFAYHALFLFAMNLLVIAPNLLQLFAGWELVGLSSYLLIGFYFAKPSAARAAVKAFWMTKLGDMGFFFGLLILFVATGSFAWTNALAPGVATAVAGLLFIAVMGKSAQFPLHVWLPDAMEGPTPVSALLHAATMVAAGVFMVVRVDPIFAQTQVIRDVMLWVGSFTAVFAALLALVQRDIKKVLAYSTCSQLGYMVAALGAGSAFAAFFHLGTHAFFKALLFLSAGSVIHAVHSNDLADMGGLRKTLPLTTTTFIIGALSLAGIPGFAGFFSKDLVLSSVQGRFGSIPWLMLLASAFLTAFYMGRVVVMAFFGKPSARAEHAHEGGLAMTAPLVFLAVPALAAGYFAAPFAHSLAADYRFEFELTLSSTPLWASTLALAGLATAAFIFGAERKLPILGVLERLDAASIVDRAWEAGYRQGLLGIARVLGWIDRYFVDGLVNLVGFATIEGGVRARKMQTGKISDYALALVLGVLLLVMWGGTR